MFSLSKQTLVISWFLLGLVVNVVGQTLYVEEALLRGINLTNDHYSGAGVSFYDWDKDGWCDLSFCLSDQPPAFYHNNNGTFEAVSFGIPNTGEGKSIQWVDYDNDGDPDIFLTRLFGDWSLYQNNGNFQFTDVTSAVGITQNQSAQTMGASWGEFNGDGYLDLYICNYNWTGGVSNYLFVSDGDGTFTEMAHQLGVDNGTYPSFQAVFFDVNMDGKSDLYVSNDRYFGYNALYLNDGTGTCQDISSFSGADIAIDAMSNSVADYDNDGDLDIYVSNNPPGNKLLTNNGDNTFTESAGYAGVEVNTVCWGAVWTDQDLDGWEDLFVSTTGVIVNVPDSVRPNYFYSNDHDGTFTYRDDSGMEEFPSWIYCAAVGDIDNNGTPDLALSGHDPHRNELWRNTTTNQSYLKISLQGISSNRDGIGATVKAFSDGQLQLRHSKCGEQHLSQNSQYLFFGFGSASVVDSITINWPSGIQDIYYDVPTGQTINYIEGASLVAVGIHQTESTSHISIIGNQISCSQAVKKLQLFNSLGQEMALPASLDVSGFGVGIYILRYELDNGAKNELKLLLK